MLTGIPRPAARLTKRLRICMLIVEFLSERNSQASRLVFIKRNARLFVTSRDGPEFCRSAQLLLTGLVAAMKSKCNRGETLITGGFTYSSSGKSVGELIVGRRDSRRLTYAGRVPFSLGRRDLTPKLEAIGQDECPLTDKRPKDGQSSGFRF